jgi:hypothetical protein
MKFKVFWISLIVMVVAFPSICFSEQPDSRVWKFLGKDGGGSFWYYNKTNLTRSFDIVSVWTFMTVTGDVRKKMIKRFMKHNIKYKNFDHLKSFNEIDCKKRLIKEIEFTDYDDQGHVLDKYTYNKSDWNGIIPGSVFEKLYQKVCITQEKPIKKK